MHSANFHMHQMQGERIDPKVISSRLGHKGLFVSYDQYVHSTGELDRKTAQILEEVIQPHGARRVGLSREIGGAYLALCR